MVAGRMIAGGEMRVAAEFPGNEDLGSPVWHVYLLRCADGTLYCGIAKSVDRRLAMHNGRIPGGARYTRSRRPVILLAAVGPMEHGAALRLEAAVKKQPRPAKLSALVRGVCLDRESGR